ncbi:MAG TPA: SDR family NAD(P)-dependent oxidoreductase [Acidimicrobiales bacterium]|nr:SDR family NAD(P)-dependent oxidoreductase [Acidimicrobiales bacterium]
MTTAIITGGSRGLGRALAAELVHDGWTVLIDGRNIDEVLATAAQLGPNVVPVPGDVTDAVHRDQLVAAAARTGGLDLLVNNASTLGPSPMPTLAEFPVDQIGEVFRTNAGAPLALIQVALPLLRRAAAPAIVNITSDAARRPYETWGLYGASKAALEQIGNVLAAEEPTVRVWSFDPGDMRTQMHQDAFPGEDISDRPLPDAVAVPAFVRMLHTRPASGFVQAGALVEVA